MRTPDLSELLMLLSNFATPIVVLLGILVLMRYLNRGETRPTKDLLLIREEVAHGLTELTRKLETARNLGEDLSEEDRKKLTGELQARLKQEATDGLLQEIRAAYDKAQNRTDRLQHIDRQSQQTIGRLKEELYALGRRGNLNLSIGIIITISGLLLLGSFVIGNSLIPIKQSTSTTLDTFLIDFIPRISLIVLIEIFAYFFLSLYKTTLSEIKYFQNEVTSMEAKFMALRLAGESESPEHVASAIDALAKTERNFILNKDQTTVDLERAKIDQAEKADVTSKLADLLRTKKGN